MPAVKHKVNKYVELFIQKYQTMVRRSVTNIFQKSKITIIQLNNF